MDGAGGVFYPDAFALKEEKPTLELEVLVLNINPGHNEKLKEKCTVLKEYTELVERTRKHGNDKNALEKAVKECIAKGVLADYLLERGSEVINMLMAEYDYEMDIEVHREEAQQEGHEKGLAEGLAEGLVKGRAEEQKNLVRKKLAKGKSLETIAAELEEDDLDKIRSLIKKIQEEENTPVM